MAKMQIKQRKIERKKIITHNYRSALVLCLNNNQKNVTRRPLTCSVCDFRFGSIWFATIFCLFCYCFWRELQWNLKFGKNFVWWMNVDAIDKWKSVLFLAPTLTWSSMVLWSVSCSHVPKMIESSEWHRSRNNEFVVLAGFSVSVNSATSIRNRCV